MPDLGPRRSSIAARCGSRAQVRGAALGPRNRAFSMSGGELFLVTRMSVDQRRSLLIEAAINVMARDGVANVGTRAIVAEADMTIGVFHYCFRSKDELVVEVLRSINRAASPPPARSCSAAPTRSRSSRPGSRPTGTTSRPTPPSGCCSSSSRSTPCATTSSATPPRSSTTSTSTACAASWPPWPTSATSPGAPTSTCSRATRSPRCRASRSSGSSTVTAPWRATC